MTPSPESEKIAKKLANKAVLKLNGEPSQLTADQLKQSIPLALLVEVARCAEAALNGYVLSSSDGNMRRAHYLSSALTELKKHLPEL